MINKEELEMLDKDRMDRVIKLLALLDRKDIISLNELMRDLKKFDNVTVKVKCDEEDMLEAYEELRDERVELLQKCENLEKELKKSKNDKGGFMYSLRDGFIYLDNKEIKEKYNELEDRLEIKNEEIDYLETYVEELKLEKSLLETLRIIESSEDLMVDVDLIEYRDLYQEQCNATWLIDRISSELGVEGMHFEGGYDDELNPICTLKVVKNLNVDEEEKNKLDECLDYIFHEINSTIEDEIAIDMMEYLEILLVKNNVAWLVKEIKNRGIEEVHFNCKHQRKLKGDWAVLCPVLKIKIPSDWEG